VVTLIFYGSLYKGAFYRDFALLSRFVKLSHEINKWVPINCQTGTLFAKSSDSGAVECPISLMFGLDLAYVSPSIRIFEKNRTAIGHRLPIRLQAGGGQKWCGKLSYQTGTEVQNLLSMTSAEVIHACKLAHIHPI
jgi:hypothetical protein